MKKVSFTLLMAAILFFFGGCSHSDDPEPEKLVVEKVIISKEIQAADQFAQDVLGTWYLWTSEVEKDLDRLDSDTCTDPITVVSQVRYNKGIEKAGVESDKWTMLTDDLESFQSSVSGVETTYGYRISGGRFTGTDKYFLMIDYVCKDTPAEKAGLKRGDIIIKLDDKDITSSNINDIYYSSNIKLTMGKISEDGTSISNSGQTYTLTAVEMYEDPILANGIFDCNGKKVGYLAYASFDLKSIDSLIKVCNIFKENDVKELILDLRYNGGGYVITEELLASLLAPYNTVKNAEVFHTAVYNEAIMSLYKKSNIDLNDYYSFEHEYTDDDGKECPYNTEEANLDLEKLYVIISYNTASASEGLVVGLSPYLPVELIGNQSSGKYCTGWLLSPTYFYKNMYTNITSPSIISQWGMYAMISTFADKNGKNASRPDGFIPDYETYDNPLDGYALGNENETMLKVALQRAGKIYTETRSIKDVPTYKEKFLPYGGLDGKSIDFPKKELFIMK